VPTVAESGYPGFDVSLWLGFFAPKGTPAAVIKRIEAELIKIVQSPEMKEQMSRQGVEAHSAGSEELGKLVRNEIDNYKTVFKTAGIKQE
jgi:tripartite-type tricarboxylate transporter receptor subunit TctC